MESRPAPSIATPQRLWLQSRETLLLLTFAALVISFTVTGFAARLYHHSRGVLAEDWYQRGVAEMQAGRAAAAVQDFQAALIYGREDVSGPQQRTYELSLAEALSAAGNSSASSRDEARSYLLDLWQQSPGDAQVNLNLARLAAQSGDDASARRYYDDAVAGVWQGDAGQVSRDRNQARQEFAQYLAGRGDQAAADAVLAGFAAAPGAGHPHPRQKAPSMSLDQTSIEPAGPPPPAKRRGLGARAVEFYHGARAHLSMREENFFLLLAVIIGLFAGLAVVCFRIAIDYTRLALLGSSIAPGPVRVLVVPTVAGLALAFIVLRFFPRVRGSGVSHTKAAVYIYDGYVPFDTVLGKFLTCALAIGSGQSLGPEDPSLQMGAGMASAIGRRLHLSRDKVRLIAPVGAAAGLAAAFNSPISAVLFVIEEVIGTWSAGILGAVVLAAVAAVVVARLFLGAEPMFQIPPYRMAHPAELITYGVLGVVGGAASILFAKLLAYVRPRLKAMPPWTYYVQPALAGLAIGVIALKFPQVMGAGYEYMDQAMHGQFIWQLLIALALLKILATTLSLSSGAPGGIFAPTLFVGAMVGAAVGSLQQRFFPGITGPLGSYALVGMGTLFAGFLRAPMTSVFMVLEISGNYSIILPVLVSNTIAYLIGRRFQPVPIFDIITRQDGLELPSMEEGREQTALRVEQAMRPPPGLVLGDGETLSQASARATDDPQDPLLVGYENGRWAAVRKAALEEAAREAEKSGRGGLPLRELLPGSRLPRLHPDQSLDLALRLLRDAPFLPVVHRANARRLVGVVSLDDILAAYRRAAGPAG